MFRRYGGIALLAIFFISGLYVDLGFALKPYVIAGIGAVCILLVNSTRRVEVRGYDYLFLVIIMYGALVGAVINPQIPLLRIVGGSLLYFISYVGLSAVLTSRYERSPDNFKKDLVTAGIWVVGLSLAIYFYTLMALPAEVLTDLRNQNLLYGVEYDRGLFRLKGLSHDPNVASLTAIFFICAAALLKSSSISSRMALFIMSLAMLLMTLSRAGILSAGLLCIYYLAAARKHWFLNIDLMKMVVLLIMIAVLFALWFQYGNAILEIVSQRQRNFFSGSGRLQIWAHAFESAMQQPLLGVGWFEYVSSVRFVHNTYLEIFVELGIVGLTLYLALLAVIFSDIKTSVRCDKDFNFLYLYFIAFLLMGMTLSIFLHETFFLMMIIIKIALQQNRNAYD